MAPVLGREKAQAYWMAYLAADKEGRERIEVLLSMMAARDLGISPGSGTIYLAPPPMELASAGSFLIGNITCNKKIMGQLRLSSDHLSQHSLVAGRSGSGKTTAAFRILASAHENGVKCLVLDWKNEYRSLVRHHAIGPGLRVFTVGKADVSPLRFNPLIPPRNTSASTHCKHVIDMVMTAYYLGEGVAHLFQVAIDALYKKFRVYDGFPEQYPTFADVAHYLSDYKPRNQREAGWLSSAVRSLSALTFGEMGQVVVTNDPLRMDELLAQDTVIEMDVSAADKAFIVQALLWNIYAHCAGRQEGNAGLTNLIVLEEAHNILRKTVASAKETIPEILLRQARSRGIGLIVVDQTISLLSPAVLGNIHNLICLSQPPSSTATKMLNLPEDGKDYTGRLEVGEAIVKIQSRFQMPFTVRFPLEPCKDQFVTDAEIREHMRTLLADSAMESPLEKEDEQSPPVPETDEIGEKEKELLKSIWEHPFNATVQKYKRLGVSRRQGQKIRQRLIRHELVKKMPCLVPEGMVVLMEITEKGRRILREIGVRMDDYNPREGGAVHRYWVERMAQKYRDLGFDVKKEVPVGDKIVDVVAESPDSKRRVGIEVMRKGESCDVVEFDL